MAGRGADGGVMGDQWPPVHCAFDELRPTGSLVPHPMNPNTHPRKQIEMLAEIIRFQGWRAPIAVSSRSGFIVRGHGRLLAAQHLGCENVPVDVQDYDNEAAEYADLVADNRIAELAEIDEDQLTATLRAIDGFGADPMIAGFDGEEFATLMEGIGEIGDTKNSDPILGGDFELPSGEIEEKTIMARVVVFVDEGVKKDFMKRLSEISAEIGGNKIRVVR